jgi:hypothetical protein
VTPGAALEQPAQLELVAPGKLAWDESDEAHRVVGDGDRVHPDRLAVKVDPAAECRAKPLGIGHRVRRVEQPGRLAVAEQFRPCVVVAFGERPQGESFRLDPHAPGSSRGRCAAE